jgi:predicted metal-dependent phosphoesterase TrpH
MMSRAVTAAQSVRVDLHVHSTTSDGELGPSEVVRLAKQRDLACIALTDHDATSGVLEAQAAGQALGVEVIAGVEINSEGEHGDAHILGYFIDVHYAPLQEQLLAIRDARVGRARGMLKKLAELDMPLEWEDVMAFAGDAVSIARPHIARAMMQAGYVSSVQEAFDRYISNDGPAYVNRLRLEMHEAIDLIHAARGVAVLAHAGESGLVHLVPPLAEVGLDGVEVYYPDHTPEQQAELLALAAQYNLVVTGGSDFHTLDDQAHALGMMNVSYTVVEALKARQRANRASILRAPDERLHCA